ncbi:uncharacterized protein LOC126812891 isoform X1 [Patella vulgata]|uniref:uncharacterized protein LOC126812891 isoform X1 n=1 Tax=Patella vulgata TaxID=6465 RepID=UPI00217F6B2B|nr:uncharacterized protein LOC126812891 isoform X1 [Patella vulgata]
MESNDLNLMPDPIILKEEDLDLLRQERQERVKSAMKEANPRIMKQILPKEKPLNAYDDAAVCIQKHYRGYRGRKQYEEKLYKLFTEEENKIAEKMKQQVKEGELLVDSHKLEVLLDDDTTARKNRDRQYLSKVIILQRAWKSHLARKHLNEGYFEETSDTESAKGFDVASLSTPEENQHADTLKSEKFHPFRDKKSPMKQLLDAESESISSDYSEVNGALQDIVDCELDIINKEDLHNTSLDITAITTPNKSNFMQRLPGETDENFSKRIKKINYLNLAQEFAELKKKNADASPYEIHMKTTASQQNSTVGKKDAVDGNLVDLKPPIININEDTCSSNMGLKKKLEKDKFETENKMSESGDFEVYNIETALPPIDWETIEQQIQLAANAATEKKNETHQNDRETIRQKLAMGTDEEYYYNERAFKKPNFQTRLQSGMNLQICFMNEAMNEAGHQEQTANKDNIKDNNKTQIQSKTQQIESKPANKERIPVNKRNIDDKDTPTYHPSRLKEEAKIALAQASTMAHMQLEVEKQLKKKSPIADMVGIPSLGDGRRKKFNRKLLEEMNLAQLQILVNDVHSQIENLNEELVHLLIERDDLHMEQDSMLVDVEDLTRYVSPAK